MRQPLRKLLREEWFGLIQHEYANQRINSERSLQAALWARLNARLPVRTRQLFVEPRFSMRVGKKSNTVLPDLVICNSRTVIAVVELKYEPRKAPSLKKDLETLELLAKSGDALDLGKERYLGERPDERRYALNDHTLFVWAGVYRASDPGQVQPETIDTQGVLADRFLSLHAVTAEGKAASVFAI
ncbi:hypothetical protein MalM25_32650 [Planctomycetes bacterium MalM25]|nr:hypothetical protein MalM25_32650 [Planctomycetes bacterium MalM25]